jgi:hypothetical protein
MGSPILLCRGARCTLSGLDLRASAQGPRVLLVEGDVSLVFLGPHGGASQVRTPYLSNMYTMQATKSSVVDPKVVLNGLGRHRVEGPLSLLTGIAWGFLVLYSAQSSRV